mgnify:CR=1 FL=1
MKCLNGGLAPGATVMSWTSPRGGIETARLHHNAIMTPIQYLYFSNPTYNRIKGTKSLERVYTFEPVSDELTEEEKQYIIGLKDVSGLNGLVTVLRWNGRFFLVWQPFPRFNGQNLRIRILTVS